MSNKIALLLVALVVTSFSFGQKKEKIKGSKIVTLAIKEIPNFDTIEVGDNFEIFLVKSDKPSIEIEADDNLHDVISLKVENNILIISTSKEIQGFKKLSVKVTYTNDLNLITTKDESIVTESGDIEHWVGGNVDKQKILQDLQEHIQKLKDIVGY
jgi:hypothetical protein